MSRRHKDNEINADTPQVPEPQNEDSGKKGMRFNVSSTSLLSRLITFTKSKIDTQSLDRVFDTVSLTKILESVGTAFLKKKAKVDDQFVKIPRDCFDPDSLSDYIAHQQEENVQRRGRNLVRRLISTVEDSKVVGFFKKTLKAAQQKCKSLYQDMKQFCVCFLRGVFKTFSPHEDPYGKLSHYHRIISSEVEGIPCRKTISNAYKWFVEWKRSAYETMMERIERERHRIWEKLIEWIYTYLIQLEPLYATR